MGFPPLGRIRKAVLVSVLALGGHPSFAQKSLQFSADEYETDLSTRVTRARGNVEVDVGDRHVQAESVDLRPQENRIEARGKVRVSEGKLSVEGDEAQVEIASSRGNFRNAILRYGTSLYVEGRKLEALGENRFQVTNGKISFCQDCPQSWSVFGTSIRLEIEGYAEIHHALFQVKDQPVAYFPVFYFPIKTKRQSGFIFPDALYSQDLGTQLGQPYFWAIAPDQDATFDYRYMTLGGHRLAAEYRYLYSDRSFIRTKTSYVRNSFDLPNVDKDRYGFNMSERWQISPQWVQRYQGEMASDTRYAASFGEDFRGSRLPSLDNKVSLAWQNQMAWSYVQGYWNANNLIREAGLGEAPKGPLNAEPEARASVPSFKLLGPLRLQSDLEHLRLRRGDNSVDEITGWIRTGDRTTLSTRAYLPVTLADLLLVESSLETRTDLYHFATPGFEASAARARVAFEEKVSAQLFRVYQVDLGELKAVKHTWEPLVSWGYSPNDAISRHPFFTQTYTDPQFGVFTSPKFDIYDPSYDTKLSQLTGSGDEARLRPHHLVSWGIGTRIIGRYERSGQKVYEEIMGIRVSQDYDLRSQLAQRLNILGFGYYSGLRVQTEIALDVTSGDANVRNEVAFRSGAVDLSLDQSIREGLETYGGSTRIKFLNPWSFGYNASYDAIQNSFERQSYQLRYDSNASKCWFFSFDVDRRPDPDQPERDLVRYWPRVGLIINEAGVSF
jgi:lipopolysaccharide assembly outer membrane protein LptD (OstA)